MRYRLALLAFVAAMLFQTQPQAQAVGLRKSHAQLVLDVVDGHILPGLRVLHGKTAILAASLKDLCSSPGDAVLRSGADANFKSVVQAWAAVEFIRFGPAANGNRLERFSFWPDPRGVMRRQLTLLLSRRDPAILEPAAMRTQSAAVQGLQALEDLLTEAAKPLTGADDDARYRCAYAAAVGRNLAGLAEEFVAEWTRPDGWRHRLLTPGSDNVIYKDAGESAGELVRALLTGLQLVQERQIVPRAEAAAKQSRPARVPFMRSGLSSAYMHAGLHSLSSFFELTGLLASAPPDKEWTRTWTTRAFEVLLRDAPRLPNPDGEKIDEPRVATGLLRPMKFHLNGLRQVIGRVLAPASEIAIGFNELDGD